LRQKLNQSHLPLLWLRIGLLNNLWMKGMKASELRKKFLKFFQEKGHAVIPGAPLIPEHDPTVLFTTAGMHPLVPFLLGEKHPGGTRLTNIQKCLRTDDIEEVGDAWHLTFFEMLGNWSLGDFWKKEAIEWSFEFLTSPKWLGIDSKKISVTVFGGDNTSPRDTESAEIWQKLGIPKERIYYLPKKDNWWGPAGQTGPCGPCTEMFYDTGKEKCGPDCKPGCGCGKYSEIWNDVFMEFNKTKEGKFKKLRQKNVDTGMGLERTIAVLSGYDNVYETELFRPTIEEIEKLTKISNKTEDQQKAVRIINDHLKASVFILTEKIVPANVEQGYVLRRLIRRAIRYGRKIGINEAFSHKIASSIIDIYKGIFPEVYKNKEFILEQLIREEEKFERALSIGLKEFEKMVKQKYSKGKEEISGRDAFYIYETFGFPLEMIIEEALRYKLRVNKKGFDEALKEHQEKSRAGAEQKFKGGLADHSRQVTKYHTATHLLLAALRKILGEHVQQKGSNITADRLRFDFSHGEKLTEDQLKKVEDLVNQKIQEDLQVKFEEMPLSEAKKSGAVGVFEEKYGDRVKVYTIYNKKTGEVFSKEICGGPHVEHVGELGEFKIIKEESSSAGVRRIRAVLE